MSVYIVNITESGHGESRELDDLAQKFHGSIYHRNGGKGSFMVHEDSRITPSEQLSIIRNHFAQAKYRVEELASPTGHVVFNVDCEGAAPGSDRFTKSCPHL